MLSFPPWTAALGLWNLLMSQLSDHCCEILGSRSAAYKLAALSTDLSFAVNAVNTAIPTSKPDVIYR